MDVKTTFLNGNLDKCIYMMQLDIFVAKGQEYIVCKFKKSIYELKQAFRFWNTHFIQVIKSYSFDQCIDDCVCIGNIVEM